MGSMDVYISVHALSLPMTVGHGQIESKEMSPGLGTNYMIHSLSDFANVISLLLCGSKRFLSTLI